MSQELPAASAKSVTVNDDITVDVTHVRRPIVYPIHLSSSISPQNSMTSEGQVVNNVRKNTFWIYYKQKRAEVHLLHAVIVRNWFFANKKVKVKVKFSHTRYRALGPELIQMYR